MKLRLLATTITAFCLIGGVASACTTTVHQSVHHEKHNKCKIDCEIQPPKPCQYDEEFSKDSPECKPPAPCPYVENLTKDDAKCVPPVDTPPVETPPVETPAAPVLKDNGNLTTPVATATVQVDVGGK